MAAASVQPPLNPRAAAPSPAVHTSNTRSLQTSDPSLRAMFLRAVDPSRPASWSAAVADLLSSGDAVAALAVFAAALRANPAALRPALPPAFRAAAAATSLAAGRQLHLLALRSGLFPSDPFSASALLHMYHHCRHPSDARKAFDEIPSPNPVIITAMASGYARNSLFYPSLALFRALLVSGSAMAVDEAAALVAFSASARVSDRGITSSLHALIAKIGLDVDAGVVNTMLDAYAKGGGRDLGAARKVFDTMDKDVVSWNSMIALYAQNGLSAEALRLYGDMLNVGGGIRCNAVTFSAVLLACAHAGTIQTGKRIHNQVVRMGLEENVYVGTSVVDMYSKCGRVEMARKAFEKIKEKNVLSWSALITGYGMHGHGQQALDVFDEMRRSGQNPNYITFISVLAACSHAGLLDKGRYWYKTMKKKFGIEPGVEHLGCMVDLLGRAGCLDEAYGLIKEMKIKPDAAIWGALLSACRIHKKVELAEISAKRLFELDATNSGYYVLLSNIYAEAGLWKDVERMRVMVKARGIEKPPGYSSVELKGKTHVFYVGDKIHPQHKEIYSYLGKLLETIQEAGYVPNTSSVLHDLDEEEKESAVRIHSEKLAVAFALMNQVPGSIIHVIKNLRVCTDCHTAMKFISRISGREIIVRDLQRFHHFKDGSCSCGDYW
ncbi:pentatricopeptide repeat-containing protein At3g26782, mitochondrial-like [Lolium rigidum]|uniref:pentatricopeptide repeat-containing protein At3g26782, mitochondrial-like n=1 Tax=Lolium rigidum TaxID=89674 RepID=UPI001F5E243D|nr:pentatricopeptide repeat-containing protein At3g26782, mitochondrial-like [Lolium rigidum]